MVKYTILLLGLLFIADGGAQNRNYVLLYRDMVPKALETNSEFKLVFESNLTTITGLNPLLIQPYLNYIDLFYRQKIKASDSNGWNEFRRYRALERNERNRWAQNIIDWIDEKSPTRLQSNLVDDLVLPLITDEIDTVSEKELMLKDSDRMFFRAVQCIDSEGIEIYDSTHDYRKEYSLLLQKKINGFAVKFEKFDSLAQAERLLLIKNALEFWYVFDERTVLSFDLINNIKLGKYIQEYVYKEFLESGQYGVEVAYETGNGEFEFPVSLKDIPYDYVGYSAVYQVDIKDLIRLNFLYTLPMKNYKGLFSSLEFRFGYLVTALTLRTDKDVRVYSSSYARIGEVITDEVFNRVKKMSSHKLSLTVSSPIFYLTKNFSLHVGLLTSLNFININNSFDQIQTTSYWSSPDKVTKTAHPYKASTIQAGILPVFSINYRLANLSLIIGSKIPRDFYIGFGYYFHTYKPAG